MPALFNFLPHQTKPADTLLAAIREHKSLQFVAGTGSGKSATIALVLSKAYKLGYIPRADETLKLYSTLVLMPRNAKLQFTRYLIKAKAPLVEIAIESPGAFTQSDKYNGILFHYISRVIRGEMQLVPVWITEQMPELLVVDESQMLRNEDSQITKIVLAYIQQGGRVIFISATPFAKVVQTKCLSFAAKLCFDDNSWSYLLNDCLRGLDSIKPHPAAMERYNKHLEERKALVKMRAQYRNKCNMFLNNCDMLPWQATYYQEAWNRYQQKLTQENRYSPTGIREIWVAMMQFVHAAEEIKAFNIARKALDVQSSTNNQIFIGAKYLSTIEYTRERLLKLGVPSSQIGEFHGKVSYDARMRAWDSFQQGRINYILTSVRCGGAALSFDHQSEFPLSRPRTSIVPLCYSPFDWIQLVGRTHRTNTASDSTVYITLFNDTIESESMAPRLIQSCKSLSKVIGRNESLMDVLVNGEFTQRAGELNLADNSEDRVNDDGDEDDEIDTETLDELQNSLTIN